MSIVKTYGDPLDVYSLATAKAQLIVGHSSHDTLITGFIGRAARKVFEDTGKQIVDTVYTQSETVFVDGLCIDRLPVKSVASIKYNDADGVQQTLSTDVYEVLRLNDPFRPALIVLKLDQDFPETDGRLDKIEIEFTTGFPTGQVPGTMLSAMDLLVTFLYENRGDTKAELSPVFRRMTEGNVSNFAG